MDNMTRDLQTPENNLQSLFASFKVQLTKKIREFSQTETPKMDHQILSLKKDLCSILNSSEDSTIEIQTKAAYGRKNQAVRTHKAHQN